MNYYYSQSVGGTITFLVFKRHMIENISFSLAIQNYHMVSDRNERSDMKSLPKDARLVDMFFDPHEINEDKCQSKKYYYTNVWQIKRERVRGKDGKIIAKDFDNIPADAVIKNIKDAKGKYIYRYQKDGLK